MENQSDCLTCSGRKKKNEKQLLLRQAAELTVFRELFSSHESILLAFDELTTDENERWGNKLFANYSACGCITGAYFLLTGFGLTLLYGFFAIEAVLANPLSYLLKGFIVWVASAVIGKLTGVIFARISLFIQLLQLKTMVENRAIKSIRFDSPDQE